MGKEKIYVRSDSNIEIVDADTLLVDAISENKFEITGFAQEIFDIYKASVDKDAVKKMFYTFAKMEFDDFLIKCRNEITR